jgi:NADH:ubiquinone oxidoreductase subunit 3 (subunit A)
MFDSMGHFENLLGVTMPVLPIFLVCTFMLLATLVSLRPRFWKNAVWKGTNVPISIRSRATGMILAWIGVALFFLVHPMSIIPLFPIVMAVGITLYLKKQRTHDGSNQQVQPIAGKPGSG